MMYSLWSSGACLLVVYMLAGENRKKQQRKERPCGQFNILTLKHVEQAPCCSCLTSKLGGLCYLELFYVCKVCVILF